MRTFTIFIIIISLNFNVNAQRNFSGGLLLGISASQIDGDAQYHYKKPGFIAGAYVLRPLSKNGGLKIETYYIGKGAVLNEDHPDGTTLQVFNTSLHYVEMPFLFNLKVHTKIEIALGIAPSYLFAEKLSSYKQVLDKNSYSFKTFDIQPIGEAGFYLTDNIMTSLRLSYSAVNIRNEPMTTWRNNNLSLVFRYKIK